MTPNSSRDQPYNSRAVVRETGIKPDTLRAWERRYGLPKPTRSAGGHRLYSQRDINTLKWLAARQEEGLSISRAVKLWHSFEAQKQDPLEEVPLPLSGANDNLILGGKNLQRLREQWIAALLDYEETLADRILSQAFAMFPVERVCFQIMQKGLSEIGELWHAGAISVQQEHFTTEHVTTRLSGLLLAAPLPTKSDRLLILCPPSEEHSFASKLLTLILKRSGFAVYYLGSNTPLEQLHTAIKRIKPQMVIACAQQLDSASNLIDTGKLLDEHKIPFGFGGYIFNCLPELHKHIPGHFLGEHLEQAQSNIVTLIARGIQRNEGISITEQYTLALGHFQDAAHQIASGTEISLANSAIPPSLVWYTINHLNKSICAALKIGEIELLTHDLNWLYKLMINRGTSSSDAQNIFRAFSQSAQDHLSSNESFLLDWLSMTAQDIQKEPLK